MTFLCCRRHRTAHLRRSAFNQIAAPIPHQDIPAVAADQMSAIIAAKEAIPPFAANNRVFASFSKMMKV